MLHLKNSFLFLSSQTLAIQRNGVSSLICLYILSMVSLISTSYKWQHFLRFIKSNHILVLSFFRLQARMGHLPETQFLVLVSQYQYSLFIGNITFSLVKINGQIKREEKTKKNKSISSRLSVVCRSYLLSRNEMLLWKWKGFPKWYHFYSKLATLRPSDWVASIEWDRNWNACSTLYHRK